MMNRIAIALCAFLGLCATARAEDAWKPERRVEFVVGNGAGGEIDRIARAVQHAAQVDHLSDANINVVNKPGTGQMVGVAYMNDHPGDPQFLSVVNMSWLAVQASRNTPDYTKVTPIAKLYSANSVFAVNADSPIHSAKDILDRMAKDVESVSFTFVARGGVEQAAIVRMAQQVKADPKKLKIVIFDNASKAALAVAGGHVDVYISSVGTALPLIQGGKLRAIAVAGPQRLPGPLAAVPTLIEQGINALSQQAYFVIAPKGLTAAQVAYWENVMVKATATKTVTDEANNEAWSLDIVKHQDMQAWMAKNYNDLRATQQAAGVSGE
jgi:putative tricarboxylic transport membrane protein